MPLVLSVTGANRHNSMTFETLVDAIPAIPSLPGRPWQCPHKLHADKGYMASVVSVSISNVTAFWRALPDVA